MSLTQNFHVLAGVAEKGIRRRRSSPMSCALGQAMYRGSWLRPCCVLTRAAETLELLMRRLALACAAVIIVPFSLHAQVNPPYIVEGPTIVQSLCTGNGPGMSSNCLSISYPSGSPILENRWVIVPRGNVEFDFPVISSVPTPNPLGKNSNDASFSVTVTAANMNPGLSAQGNAQVDFSKGPGTAVLKIPLNLDWAESVITLQIVVNQKQCVTSFVNKPGMTPKTQCTIYSSLTPGPALSSPATTAPAILGGLTNASAFVLLVTPAAAFQLEVLPVAIVYAPLGSGRNAQSSLTMSATVGSNIQVGTVGQTTYAGITDDKTTYQGDLSFGITVPSSSGGSQNQGTNGGSQDQVTNKLSLGFGVKGSWDNAVETDVQSSDGTTNSVLTTEQQSDTFSVVLPSGQPPLNQVTCSTQPFLNDLILAVKDVQYALWDYPGPGGILLQPLGNAGLFELPVKQLDACKVSASVPQSVCDSGNPNPHCFPYPDPDATKNDTFYLDISSADCGSILSLDSFYIKATQDALPVQYAQLFSGSIDTANPNAFSDTRAVTATTTQTSTIQITTKNTSTLQNTNDINGGLSLLGALNINYDSGGTDYALGGNQTTSYGSLLSTTNSNTKTLTDQIQASMTIQDPSGSQAPVRVVWDTTFQGVAAEDTGMELACAPNGPMATVRRPGGSSPQLSLETAKTLPKLGAQQRALPADAAHRHVARSIPAPPPPLVGVLSPQDALKQLNRLSSKEKPVLDATKGIQAMTQKN